LYDPTSTMGVVAVAAYAAPFISQCLVCHRAVKLLTPLLKSNTRSSAVTDEIHSMYSIVTRGHVNGEVRGYLIAGMAAITDWSTNITMYLH